MLRISISIPFLILSILLAPYALSVHGNGSPVATSGDGCAWWDVFCHFAHFFQWLVTQGFKAALRPFEPAINYTLVQPLARLGIALPVFNASVAKWLEPFATNALSDAMEAIWSVSMWVGFAILAAGFILSTLWLVGEAGGLARPGEGVLFMKRALVIAALIPVSAKLYDLSATLIALANSYILPIKDFVGYCDSLAGTVISLALIFGLFGGWTFLLGVLLTGFVLMVLGAMRLLLVAILASLLPIALALSIFPLSFVRRFGETMLGMLVNLMLASIVCAAIFRFGTVLGQHTWGDYWVDASIRIIVFFACALAPALSLALAPRAAVGMYITSLFLGYAFRPWIRTVARELYPQLAFIAASAQRIPVLGRVVRVGATLYRITKQPGGALGYVASSVAPRVSEWIWRKRHPELAPIYEEMKRRITER